MLHHHLEWPHHAETLIKKYNINNWKYNKNLNLGKRQIHYSYAPEWVYKSADVFMLGIKHRMSMASIYTPMSRDNITMASNELGDPTPTRWQTWCYVEIIDSAIMVKSRGYNLLCCVYWGSPEPV